MSIAETSISEKTLSCAKCVKPMRSDHNGGAYCTGCANRSTMCRWCDARMNSPEGIGVHVGRMHPVELRLDRDAGQRVAPPISERDSDVTRRTESAIRRLPTESAAPQGFAPTIEAVIDHSVDVLNNLFKELAKSKADFDRAAIRHAAARTSALAYAKPLLAAIRALGGTIPASVAEPLALAERTCTEPTCGAVFGSSANMRSHHRSAHKPAESA